MEVHPASDTTSQAESANVNGEPHPNGVNGGISGTEPSLNGHAEGSATATSTTPSFHPIKPLGQLRCMSLGFLLPHRSSAVIWRGPKKTAMVRQFLSDVLWGPTDYLLIDTPPGTSDEHIALAEQLLQLPPTTAVPESTSDDSPARSQLAGAVLVTTPQAISTSDVRKELNFCHKTSIPILGIIENMAGFVCPCCGEISNVFSKGGGEVMAGEFGVQFLGGVPVDMGFGSLVEEQKKDGGFLVDRYRRECLLCPVFERLAGKIVEGVEGRAANGVRERE